MRIPRYPSRILVALVAAAAVLLAVDAGSLALARTAAPDRLRDAGHAAVEAIDGMPVSQRTAQVAFDAARLAAADDALVISADDFRVLPDGRIRLTGTRTSPTLVLHRLPRLRDLIEVSVTETVAPLAFQSAAR